MFAQLKQQVSINKNLTDVSSKLDNLSTNMSEPINPQTPGATVLTKINQNVNDLKTEVKTLTKERAEGNRNTAQQVNETKKLTSAVNSMSKKMDGFTEMIGTFLLFITQQTATEDNTAEAHNLLCAVMSGITDGVWDDEEAKVAFWKPGETRIHRIKHPWTVLRKNRPIKRSPPATIVVQNGALLGHCRKSDTTPPTASIGETVSKVQTVLRGSYSGWPMLALTEPLGLPGTGVTGRPRP